MYVWCVCTLHVFLCVYKHACGGQRAALDVGLYLPYVFFEAGSLCCLALMLQASWAVSFRAAPASTWHLLGMLALQVGATSAGPCASWGSEQ